MYTHIHTVHTHTYVYIYIYIYTHPICLACELRSEELRPGLPDTRHHEAAGSLLAVYHTMLCYAILY